MSNRDDTEYLLQMAEATWPRKSYASGWSPPEDDAEAVRDLELLEEANAAANADLLELAADAKARARARKQADPAALVEELADRTVGPESEPAPDPVSDLLDAAAEPERGSWAWRVRELAHMGINVYRAEENVQ